MMICTMKFAGLWLKLVFVEGPLCLFWVIGREPEHNRLDVQEDIPYEDRHIRNV